MHKLKTLLPIFFLIMVSLFVFLPVFPKNSIMYTMVESVRNMVSHGIDNIKSLFAKEEKVLSIDSSIGLAPDGDIDKNNIVDSGDTIRFQYVLSNTTENDYSWLTLDTNIDRKLINYIHNGYGAINLEDSGKTITFRHVKIPRGQTTTIRFDARVNHSIKKDLEIITEPKLIDRNSKVILSSTKEIILARKSGKQNRESGVDVQQLKLQTVK